MTVRVAVLCVIFAWHEEAVAAAERLAAPWDWTRAERLARRYDSALAAERRRNTPQCASGCGEAFIVDGRLNPELLLPTELMDTLAGMYTMSNAERRGAVRAQWLRHAPAAQRDHFWDELHAAGRPFFESWAEFQRLNAVLETASESDRERLQARRDEVFDSLCARRVAALAAARTLFSEKEFDRFLYEAIAPGVFISESGGTVSDAIAREEGCR